MRIENLLPPGEVGKPWLLSLENGELLKVSQGAMIDFALHKDKELAEDELEALRAAEAHTALKDKAVALLLQRPYSKRELVTRLLRQKATEAQAAEIADWTAEIGLLDEGLYAGRIVRHYSQKGFGPYKIRDELYRRGIPRDLWEAALLELPEPEETIADYLRRNLRGTDPRSLKRATDALGRRGFSWSDISQAVRRFEAEWED